MIELFMSIFVVLMAWASYRIGARGWASARRADKLPEIVPTTVTGFSDDPSTVATWTTRVRD